MEQIYTNIQTKEVLNMDKVRELADNAMLKVKPELWETWDFEKNKDLGIWELSKGSHKKVWWICLDCKSSYEAVIYIRTTKGNCPYCAGQKVNHTNSLASLRPDLVKEWHSTLNKELTPHDVTCGKKLKVWWKCPECKSNYDMRINHRINDSNCPYCSGQRINHTNCLATINPELASEWHPTLNGELTPSNVTCNSNKKVWWLGKCGHEWRTAIVTRSKGSNCPYCSKYKAEVLKGFNDLWTTHPEVAIFLANAEDGYKYSHGSEQKLDWKCPECGCEILNKSITNVVRQKLSCVRCSDGFPYTEKLVFNMLDFYKLKFEWEVAFSWSNGKRYDFYLTDYNMIIEVHGKQHYTTPFNCSKSRTLQEEKVNDEYKRNIATKNGIDYYVVIDAKVSELNHIRESIYNSDLSNIIFLDDANWNELDTLSRSSIFMKVINNWNNRMSIEDISKDLKIDKSTVRRYLRRGSESSLCNYTLRVRKIAQLEGDSLIAVHDNLKVASNNIGLVKGDRIGKCCKGLLESAYGFKWMYKEDYDNLIKIKQHT